MGGCLSFPENDEVARARSEEIDKQLQIYARQEANVIKILLLGAGESGKSTLVRQMKIIHNDGFTSEELKSFRTAVYDNLFNSLKYVLSGMGQLRIPLHDFSKTPHAQTVLTYPKCYDVDEDLIPEAARAVHELLNDRGVQYSIARGFEYQLNDSAKYFFDHAERILDPLFVPNMQDALRVRIRTTGIIETCFRVNGIIFRLFDVGGQRSERKKWIHCFDDVRAILFVMALSDYDMTLIEDSSTNRLEESLTLFNGICNNRFFVDTSVILFLNKVDLFREKVLQSGRHLRYFFSTYTGPDMDVDAAARFIQALFISQIRSATKVVYPHFTTATDTCNIQVVFQVVMDTIVKENLAAAALL